MAEELTTRDTQATGHHSQVWGINAGDFQREREKGGSWGKLGVQVETGRWGVGGIVASHHRIRAASRRLGLSLGKDKSFSCRSGSILCCPKECFFTLGEW